MIENANFDWQKKFVCCRPPLNHSEMSTKKMFVDWHTVGVGEIPFKAGDIEIFTDLPTANYVCSLNKIIYVRRFFKYLYQANKSPYTHNFISICKSMCWVFVGIFWPLVVCLDWPEI